MKTRVKKWARYRHEIQKTPMERFETKKAKPIANVASAPSFYELYRKKQIRLAALQGAVFLLCLILFAVWYAVWVR
ncbi:MAG: hypothetical protein PUC66_05595 [Erysipelotrichaceae bacterium]|nr:hypothetical protein [Erysipelotrichaceae bacterium]